MGLIRELFSEIIELPDQFTISTSELKEKVLVLTYNKSYAILNFFFQIIDCIIIPFYTMKAIHSLLAGFHFFVLIGCILGLCSSTFSIGQSLYYFIKPVDKYINFKNRLLGETALGVLLSALFGIRIRHYR